MPSFLAISGTEAPVASSASASRSMRTICCGVCLFFIENPPCAHLGPSDSHSNWISFRGAGHHPVLIDKKIGQGRLWRSEVVAEWWWFSGNIYVAKREKGYQS